MGFFRCIIFVIILLQTRSYAVRKMKHHTDNFAYENLIMFH